MQKRQLINTGYYHGYKGYRYFKNSSNRLPFSSYEEAFATIQYDAELKSLFYSKIMFIETSVKNIALNCILTEADSEHISDMYDKLVSSYRNAPAGSTEEAKKKMQSRKLRLQGSIQNSLEKAYKNCNPTITHFYNNMSYSGVPIWALFEILTMGDFGFLLECLTYRSRDVISCALGLNLSADTDRELVYKYIYALKELRNAVAHNAVVFDTRFRRFDPSNAMKRCLQAEVGLPYVNFKTLGDYVILICYYLKMLKISKTEIKAFIRDFEKITDTYKKTVNPHVAAAVIHPDLPARLAILKNYI
ncbi:MAG: Abi family protein [Clostridiaceae bacterium]